MNNKFLPIGSVVSLKNSKKSLMITGFLSAPKENRDKVFDYCGCLYPEGYLKSNQIFLFNHDQIEKINFIGYKNKEEEKFKNKLEATLNTINRIKNLNEKK